MAAFGDLTQLLFGLQDRRKGMELEAQAGERPQYEIPESVDKMISMYRQMAQGGMPGEDLARGDIQASTARTATTAGQLADSPIAALTALGGAQQRELGALRDLQQRASMYRSQMQQGYAGVVGNRANFEQEQWRQNQLLPWEIDMNRAMGFQSSGAANIVGGISGMEDSFKEVGATALQATMGMPPVGGGANWGGGGQGSSNAATQYGMVNYGWNGSPQSSGLGVGGSYVPPWQGGQ